MKLKCSICGVEFKSLLSHVKSKHDMKPSKYREIYGVKTMAVYSDEQKRSMSDSQKRRFSNESERKKNSDRQKNGASCFTETYWIKRGMSSIESKNKVSEIQKENAKKSILKTKPEYSHFNKQYWIIKKGLSEEDAVKRVSELQSILSFRSSKFKGKVRSNESKLKISNSMKKKIEIVGSGVWASHFGYFNGSSKIEREFFCYIKENINKNVEANFPIKNYIVDVISNKKIVEFYGDFWHANPNFYKVGECLKYDAFNTTAEKIWKKDKLRVDFLKSMGYDVLVIWENDWIKNKKECIDNIKKFYENDN